MLTLGIQLSVTSVIIFYVLSERQLEVNCRVMSAFSVYLANKPLIRSKKFLSWQVNSELRSQINPFVSWECFIDSFDVVVVD